MADDIAISEALKQLVFAARTSGGTAGRDEVLCAACDKAEAALAQQFEVATALKLAIDHIEHMAKWIGEQKAGYSFESLGEDMPGLRATLASVYFPHNRS